MRAIGTENTWFSFKGIRNDALNVRMLSMPIRPHPGRKGKIVDILGTDGEFWQDGGGYKRIVISIRLITLDNSNIDIVNEWLSGEGDLIFGDEPERAYHARIAKEFSRSNRSQRLRGQEFTVSFDCDPFRYSANPAADMFEIARGSISETAISYSTWRENPATMSAAPLIIVTGEGDGWIEVDTNTTGQYNTPVANTGVMVTLTGLNPSTPVYIDCAAKVAYISQNANGTPTGSANGNVYAEKWAQISPGKRGFIFSPSIIKTVIHPRWRWL